jgi:hypothetical protein
MKYALLIFLISFLTGVDPSVSICVSEDVSAYYLDCGGLKWYNQKIIKVSKENDAWKDDLRLCNNEK